MLCFFVMIMKIKGQNFFLLIILVLMLVPHTRFPMQVLFNKGLALISSPSLINKESQIKIERYNWELKDFNGSSYNLETVKGKVVFINFWATWCPPCIAELPSIQALYNDYSDKIEFIFISQESPQTIKQFLNKENYTFNVYGYDTKPPVNFDVSTIPRTFLIDKNGTIIFDKIGASNWNSSKVRSTIDLLLK